SAFVCGGRGLPGCLDTTGMPRPVRMTSSSPKSGAGWSDRLGVLDRGCVPEEPARPSRRPRPSRPSQPPQRRRRPWRFPSAGVPRFVAHVVILAVAYFAALRLGVALRGGSLTGPWPVCPAAGVALAGLVLFGRRAWPGLAIGGLLAAASGHMPPHPAWITVGQTAAAIGGATLLRTRGFDRSLVRPGDVLCLIAVG